MSGTFLPTVPAGEPEVWRILPPALDADQAASLRARLQRLRDALSAHGIGALRLHLVVADGAAAVVIDDAGRTLWNAAGNGLALRAWRDSAGARVDDVAQSPSADPQLDLDLAAATFNVRCFVRVRALAGENMDDCEDAILELRLASPHAPAHLGDLARAVWRMQADAHAGVAPLTAATTYRAQALAAIDGSDDVEPLPLLRRGLGRGLRRGVSYALGAALLCAPLFALLPTRVSVAGQGHVVVANAPVQAVARNGRVVALATAVGRRVRAGNTMFWMEDPDARANAELAYRNFAAAARKRLLDATADASAVPDRLATLRIAAEAGRLPVVADVDGTVRELPRVGETVERGQRIGFVMPDRPVFELDAEVDAFAADALRVGDTGRVRMADGREWRVRIARIDARARSVDDARGAAQPRARLGVRATLLDDRGLVPEMPVQVQFDGARMPIYRQWLRRWETLG